MCPFTPGRNLLRVASTQPIPRAASQAWFWQLEAWAVMGTVLTSQSGQRYAGTAGLSSELLQVRPRDKATLSISFHSPPAILPFQDDRQNVSRGNVQLIRILGKKWQVCEMGRATCTSMLCSAAPTLAVHACLSPRASSLLSHAQASRVVPLEIDRLWGSPKGLGLLT